MNHINAQGGLCALNPILRASKPQVHCVTVCPCLLVRDSPIYMLFCGCAIAHSFAYYTQWMQLTGTLDPQIGLRCLNLESRKTMYFLCFVCTCVVSDKMLTLRRNAHHQMEDRSLSPSCSPNRFTCEGVLVPLQMA